MNKLLKLLIAAFALVGTLLVPVGAFAFQAKDASSKTAKAAATSGPSDKDIADAKTKGLVWVNTNSKVYHKDGEFYGKTKKGEFMTEADAIKAGNRAAKQSAAGEEEVDGHQEIAFHSDLGTRHLTFGTCLWSLLPITNGLSS